MMNDFQPLNTKVRAILPKDHLYVEAENALGDDYSPDYVGITCQAAVSFLTLGDKSSFVDLLTCMHSNVKSQAQMRAHLRPDILFHDEAKIFFQLHFILIFCCMKNVVFKHKDVTRLLLLFFVFMALTVIFNLISRLQRMLKMLEIQLYWITIRPLCTVLHMVSWQKHMTPPVTNFCHRL